MLDFNARPKIQDQITSLIDVALIRERAVQTARDYLGASRLGVACERALQYSTRTRRSTLGVISQAAYCASLRSVTPWRTWPSAG